MSEQRVLFLQKGLIGTCALVALVLLFSFYGVVSESVHRAAARQRLANAGAVAPTVAVPAQRNAARNNALLARVGN